MKSTYDLLSIFLDNQPVPVPAPKVIDSAMIPDCSEIEEEYNLSDLPVCRRKVSGIKLLSTESPERIFTLIDHLVECRVLYVLLDYISISQTARKLYLKRVLQAIALIISAYPQIAIFLVCDDMDLWVQLRQMYTPSE